MERRTIRGGVVNGDVPRRNASFLHLFQSLENHGRFPGLPGTSDSYKTHVAVLGEQLDETADMRAAE